MSITELRITHLRNIENAHGFLHPQLTLVLGQNGSGKTSFLEALYLLSCGHSFRTRDISALVSYEKEKLTVFAAMQGAQSISLQKAPGLSTTARINGLPCASTSELALFLPCQLFYQDIFQIIDAGPGQRRDVLNWGLFHVEPEYHSWWKNYRLILKQRNSLLRQQAKPTDLLPWNRLLSEAAQQLDQARNAYCLLLADQFKVISRLFTGFECELMYYRGWDKKNEGKSLETVLMNCYAGDLAKQYTYYGPHHADLIFTIAAEKSSHLLSRGQQKMLLFALKFAQAKLLKKPCLFLIDDLASELDLQHIEKILHYCSAQQEQIVVSVRPNDFLHFQQCLKSEYSVIKLVSGQILDIQA